MAIAVAISVFFIIVVIAISVIFIIAVISHSFSFWPKAFLHAEFRSALSFKPASGHGGSAWKGPPKAQESQFVA